MVAAQMPDRGVPVVVGPVDSGRLRVFQLRLEQRIRLLLAPVVMEGFLVQEAQEIIRCFQQLQPLVVAAGVAGLLAQLRPLFLEVVEAARLMDFLADLLEGLAIRHQQTQVKETKVAITQEIPLAKLDLAVEALHPLVLM